MPGYEIFGKEERDAIQKLLCANNGVLFAHGFEGLRNGIFKVRDFEKVVSDKFQIKYAQAVSSCTAALRIALEVLGVGRGDEVIIPAFTFVATAEAVLQCGAKPVIVDIDDSFTMDPEAFKNSITSNTKVVIPVHMMSAPADMHNIMEIALKNNIKVVEDAAWGVGGLWRGKALGTIGHIGCYSFDAGKCITTGEGGMLVTNDHDLYRKARAYHDHGHEYASDTARGEDGAIGDGFNYRMTEIQGVIGIEQFKKLDFIIKKQRENRDALINQLRLHNFPYKLRKILDQEGDTGDVLIFMLESKNQADHFLARMKQDGLSTKNIPDAIRWHFAKNWNHIFQKYGFYAESYKSEWRTSEKILEKSIAVPIYIKMTKENILDTAKKLVKIAKEVNK